MLRLTEERKRKRHTGIFIRMETVQGVIILRAAVWMIFSGIFSETCLERVVAAADSKAENFTGAVLEGMDLTDMDFKDRLLNKKVRI